VARKRRICVFTATRAEYGLLRWLCRLIAEDSAMELRMLVSGMHLSAEFGETWREIAEDGLPIDARVEMLVAGDGPGATAASMGVGLIRFADALASLRPDMLIVLGDRFETLAVAQAAMLLRIPIAHIHGGEATEGLIDEAIRHAVTKMAHVHFTAADPYRRRVVQMGESPDRVFVTGALGIDSLFRLPLLDRPALEDALDFPLDRPTFLVTYHPETLSDQGPEATMRALFAVLDRHPETGVILTKANADPNGRAINRLIDAYAAAWPGRVLAVASLGHVRYLSALRLVDAVIGNSSSGIIEAPAAGRSVVNIGDRQRGRLRAPAVIDCGHSEEAIAAAVDRALDPAFRRMAAAAETPYGCGGAAERIAATLRDVPLDGILLKRFHDLPDMPA